MQNSRFPNLAERKNCRFRPQYPISVAKTRAFSAETTNLRRAEKNWFTPSEIAVSHSRTALPTFVTPTSRA